MLKSIQLKGLKCEKYEVTGLTLDLCIEFEEGQNLGLLLKFENSYTWPRSRRVNWKASHRSIGIHTVYYTAVKNLKNLKYLRTFYSRIDSKFLSSLKHLKEIHLYNYKNSSHFTPLNRFQNLESKFIWKVFKELPFLSKRDVLASDLSKVICHWKCWLKMFQQWHCHVPNLWI